MAISFDNLIFICPRKRRGIAGATDIDGQGPVLLVDNELSVRCRHCGEVHRFKIWRDSPWEEAA